MPQYLNSAFLYILGMSSMFVVDFYVVFTGSVLEISDWALTKSIVLIGAVLVLLGHDQVLVRFPARAKQVFNRGIVAVCTMTAVYLFLMWVISVEFDLVWTYLAIAGISLSTLSYGVYRAFGKLSLAQLFANGWKVLLLPLIVVASELEINYSYSALIAICPLIVLVFLKVSGQESPLQTVRESLESSKRIEELKLGFKFLISLLTLTLSLYIEQVLLNKYGTASESALFFAHVSIILPPIVFLNGYLGFVLGPYVRDKPAKVKSFLKNRKYTILILAVLISLLSFVVAQIVFSYLVGDEALSFVSGLGAIIAGIGLLRLLYTLPSACIGMIGTSSHMNRFVTSNVFGVCIFIVTFIVLVKASLPIIYAVGFASLANWILRVVYGYVVLVSVFSDENNWVKR